MFRKTEDGAIDNLLRAQVGRGGGPPPLCQEFDPDLANAYVEHCLPARARAHYEQHLSLCASCRKSVVTLARMADAEVVFTEKSRVTSLPREPRWKALLGAMSRPQWAMAAVAVVILVVSVPLVLSRKGTEVNQSSPQSTLAQPPSSADAPAEYRAEQGNAGGQAVDGGRVQPESARQIAASQQDTTAPKPARSAEDSREALGQTSAETAGGVAGGVVARSEPPPTQPVEAKSVNQ
ncbi:MAG TPA: zf-HC2 domain-containing protein, partial [Blastocatellia bacterium]